MTCKVSVGWGLHKLESSDPVILDPLFSIMQNNVLLLGQMCSRKKKEKKKGRRNNHFSNNNNHNEQQFRKYSRQFEQWTTHGLLNVNYTKPKKKCPSFQKIKRREMLFFFLRLCRRAHSALYKSKRLSPWWHIIASVAFISLGQTGSCSADPGPHGDPPLVSCGWRESHFHNNGKTSRPSANVSLMNYEQNTSSGVTSTFSVLLLAVWQSK